MRLARPILALAATLAVACGCSERAERDPGAAATPQTDKPDKPPPSPPPPHATAQELRVLDPGAEPRTAMRYTLPKARERVTIEIGVTQETILPGLPTPATTLPTLRFTLDYRRSQPLSEMETRVGFTLVRATVGNTRGVEPTLLEPTRYAMRRAAGMKGTVVLDKRGVLRDPTIALPPDVPAELIPLLSSLEEALAQITVPFPEQEIGVGAAWQVDQVINAGGIGVEQRMRYELTEWDGKSGKLTATIEQTAVRQSTELPGLSAEVESAELTSWTGKGDAAIAMSLDRVTPKSASITLEVDARYMLMRRNRGEQELRSRTTVAIEARSP